MARRGSASFDPDEKYEKLPSIEEQERIRLFVSHYVVDRDAKHAAQMMGVEPEYASRYGHKLLEKSFTKALIRKTLDKCARTTLVTPDRIVAKLWEEANNPFWQAAGARVKALDILSDIFQLKEAKPEGSTTAFRVMIVPMLSSPDEWEKMAEQQQAKLRADTEAAAPATVDV